MSFGYENRIPAGATVVSNAFIDEYMTMANGEYVKVYLYLLRHAGEEIGISSIADAMNHTEADVKRALAYWEKAGVLGAAKDEENGARRQEEARGSQERRKAQEGLEASVQEADGRSTSEAAAPARLDETLATMQPESPEAVLPPQGDGLERMERLAADEEFSALLYAVQQYLGKTFTQIECEKFAFFYDGLHMSGELLEYLAEYCAGGGHANIRYIEKVALNWYKSGIRTKEEARDFTVRFSKDTSAVMKAFGITGRNPGTAEQEYMRKWFREYGFDGAIVTEACNRTITATGAASFPYADKILAGWKENGVKVLRDIEELDTKRQQTKNTEKGGARPQKGGSPNRF